MKFQILLVGLGRFELPTSPLSGVRSNQLSYRPVAGLLPQNIGYKNNLVALFGFAAINLQLKISKTNKRRSFKTK